MDRRLHLANCYNKISAIIERAGTWLEESLPASSRYQRRAVIARLKQRLADILHYPFLIQQMERADSGSVGEPARKLKCAGLLLRGDNGSVRPQFSLVLRSLREFAKHWLYILVVATAALFRPAAARGLPATLVFGVGEADLRPGGNDAEFFDYCRAGPICPLRNASRIIVQSANVMTSKPDWVVFARHPLFRLLRESGPTMADYLRFLVQHLASAWLYTRDIVRFPLLCILAQDYAYFSMIVMLNRRRLIENFVLTMSQYHYQPLWMTDLPSRKYRTHLVFYSMMGRAFVYKHAPVEAIFPGFRYLRADEFWIWTHGQATLLRSLGLIGDFHVTGPVVWRIPVPHRQSQDRRACITVFDVTPFSRASVRRQGLAHDYYETGNALEFMSGILAARDQVEKRLGIKARIVLKHKRAYHPTHDDRYVKQINTWCNISHEIDLAPPDCNVLSLVESSKVVIVAPFSSPAYIAAQLGVTAVYYDPTRELVPTFEPHSLIHFASGPGELCDFLMHLFSANASSSSGRVSGLT